MTDLVFVEETPMEGREHQLAPGATIGREGCDLVLADPEVSRRHAAIRAAGGGLAVEDLGSTNGTFVNDERIERVRELKDGDAVRIGSTVLRVRDAAPATHVGGQRAGAPQVTVFHPAAPEVQATPQEAGVAEAAPAVVSSAPPAAVRGDVPAPPAEAPSAIRRVLPSAAASQPPSFTAPPTRTRGSAATRVEATVICWIVVIAVAVAVAVYFATY